MLQSRYSKTKNVGHLQSVSFPLNALRILGPRIPARSFSLAWLGLRHWGGGNAEKARDSSYFQEVACNEQVKPEPVLWSKTEALLVSSSLEVCAREGTMTPAWLSRGGWLAVCPVECFDCSASVTVFHLVGCWVRWLLYTSCWHLLCFFHMPFWLFQILSVFVWLFLFFECSSCYTSATGLFVDFEYAQ